MYRVTVCQMNPELKDPAKNLNTMLEMLSQLDSDLVVFPELCTTGYVFNDSEEIRSVAESIPEGDVYQKLHSMSIEKDISIVYGFAELHNDKLFNSCALLNPDGTYYIYRKTHLFYREKLLFEPGNTGFEVFRAKNNVSIGMMICFDWQFPEAARSLALSGAQIICHPSNLVLPWAQEAMKTRSLENRVYSITSNRIGIERNGELTESFTGQSQILGTKGEILIRLDSSSCDVATVVIDPSIALDKTVTTHNNAFLDRRPEMYKI